MCQNQSSRIGVKFSLSQFWQELWRLQGTKLKFSTAYHPQSDGQTEVVNRGIEAYLCCFAGEQPKKWAMWLPWAEYSYNTSFHTSSNTTPFKILYGRDPPTLTPYSDMAISNSSVDQMLMDRDRMLTELKVHWQKAQQRMKISADKHQRDIEYSMGQWVFLKTRLYRQTSCPLIVARN